MKKYLVLPVLVALFAGCSNPLLKWIETSSGDSGSYIQPLASDKAITAFSFNIPGEEISIRAEPVQDGTIPIKVVLPPNTSLERLGPSIRYIGESITPPEGTAQTAQLYTDSPRNFTNPQVYTVTAGDGSKQSYTVQAFVKDAAPASIVWFDLEIPGGKVMSEGVITEGSGGQPGEIILHVPSGTNLTSLTAKVAQTGTLSGPGVSVSGDSRSAVTLTGDFSPSRPRTERTYTVTAGDGTAKAYTVTVITDRSGVKEITAFFFTESVNNETVIIGGEPQPDGKYPIVVTVPVTADVAFLTPTIVYKGADIDGAGISDSHGANFDNPLPASADSAQDFTTPVTYRITAEDGSVRDYEVTVYRSDLNTGKQITGFYFSFPNAQGTQGSAGIINETAKTIAITVPAGTNLTSLAPAIYHTGVSISPMAGEPRNFTNPVSYTVTARDGSTAAYRVSVFVAKSSDKAITAFDFANAGGETTVIGSVPDAGGKIPIVVTVPSNTVVTSLTPLVTHTGASITGGGIPAGGPGTVTGSPSDFTGPVIYTVTAEDGSTRDYSVTVVKTADPTLDPESALARIDGFYVNNPMAVGTIDQSAKTIAVTVPYGTDVTNLAPTIYFTGKGIVQGTAIYTGPNMTTPASIAAAFSSSVQYTVTALNGTTPATYTVTVTVDTTAPPQSSVRAITFVGFAGVNDVDLTCTVSTAPDSSGKYPVEVLVPAGTDISSLTPVILYKDRAASISGLESFSPPDPHPTDPEIEGIQSSASVNFSTPQTYTVTSEDGASSEYIVTVRKEDNNLKEITSFYFTSPVAVGVIDQNAKTIDVTVPNGTNLTSLSPTVSYTGVSLYPASGAAVNFSSPVSYTVTARNGTAQPYTVRVKPIPASAKEITAVSFPGIGVIDTIIGAIPDTDGHIPISVTVSGQTDIGVLRPTITHTGVSITPPGETAQSANPFTDSPRHFGSPQVYRITAEDGGFKEYTVSVHASGSGARVITGFMFTSVSVVGQINQDTHVIEVKVPHSADISDLTPTITYLGESLGYADTSGATPAVADTDTAPSGKAGNTYTDNTARDFSADRFYTVKAADGSTQEYTVKVTKIPEVTISYEGLRDDKFITESFDQRTGLLTITIITTNPFPGSDPPYFYNQPYDWYVDGIDQPLADTQNTLVIRTTDFEPGRHQVTASATKNSDGKHYTNIVYFVVQE